MVKIIRWLLGWVKFAFVGGFNEGFLDSCYEEKYNIRNITVDGKTLYAECLAGLYPRLRKPARENGGRLKIIKKHGFPFIFLKIRNRWGIFTGIVIGIAFISFISGFAWNIEITGNERLSEETVRAFLAENGFYEGARFKSVDRPTLEKLLLASFDDIAWAHINRNGTSATVEINEAVIRPKTVNRKKYANLKAKKSGVIVKATAYDGWAKVRKGDAVNKGDLLISGIYTNEKGKTYFTRARGQYIAEVKEKFELTVSRQQSYKRSLSETERTALLLFGLRIPLYLEKTPKNAEVETQNKRIILNGKALPVGLEKSIVRVYKKEVKTLSDGELTALSKKEAERKLKKEYGKYEIIKQKIDTELTDSAAVSKGYVLCLEDIGKEVRIKIKKNK